jgi:hypothetical protein
VRYVSLHEFVSIDGLVAGLALMDTIDTLPLGRVTYGMFAGFWPKVTEDAEKEFADRFTAVPKVVVSSLPCLSRAETNRSSRRP